ncbi:MAG: hypothetical protein KTR15_04550 [Phycisphaeraceae bacterium]|nr:hypothetical protein [Phycisphaeraceae bacterium]
MGSMSAMMFVLLFGGGGNAGDLLDFTPTESYWEMRDQRIIDIETMSAVLEDDDATATDTLMAIRAIGEQVLVQEADPDAQADPADKAKALKLLTPYVGSKEPFVDQYAKRSIAWVKGEEPKGYAPLPAEVYDLDLALLPSDATIVGQMKIANGVGPVDLAGLIPDIKIEGQSIRDQMMSQMLPGLLQGVQMIGNARADLVTAGFVLNDKEDVSFMLVVRGQYDRVGVQVALEEAMGEDEDASFYSVGEIEVVSVANHDPVAMLMPSDELFIFLFAEDRGTKLPIDSVAKKLAQADPKPSLSAELAKQVAKIDRKKADVWAAMKVTQIMKDEPEVREVFGAFDAARATATRGTDGKMDIQWVGEGSDAAEITKTADHITALVKEGIAEFNEMKQQVPQEMRVLMGPMVEMMESMKFNADGKTMTGGMKVDPNIGMTMPMMMFGVRVQVEREWAEVEAAEDVADNPF